MHLTDDVGNGREALYDVFIFNRGGPVTLELVEALRGEAFARDASAGYL